MQPIGPTSLIQSTVPGDTGRWRALLRAPRLDAVVRRADADGVRLEHYHRTQGRPDRGWDRGATLTTTSTAPGALAQLPDTGRLTPRWRAGALVALVPDADGVTAWHHDPHGEPLEWRRGQTLGPADAVALVARGADLHALLVTDGRLRHWRGTAAEGWSPGADLGEVGGAPALTLTPRGLAAAVRRGEDVEVLAWTPGAAWAALARIPAPLPARRVPAAPRDDAPHPEGDEAAPAPEAPGTPAWADDAPPALAPLPEGGLILGLPDPVAGVAWHRGGLEPGAWTAAAPARPDLARHARVRALALAPTALGGGVDATRVSLGAVNLGGAAQALGRGTGWLQALVAEDDSVYLWHRERRRDATRWVRAAGLRVLTAEPTHHAARASEKTAQISGERDTQPSPGDPRRTLSRSETVSGVRGTDLGVRVDVAGSSIMLFGDTHWGRKRWATRDAVARIDHPDAELPAFEFHGGPLAFSGLGTTMTEYDVPLDAFAHGGHWYAFTSSNHFARHQVMGRSLLARALDDPTAITGGTRRPFRFETLTQVSDLFFINISCQPLRRSFPGSPFPDGDGPLLALWGAGSYRADDLRFAVLDPSRPLERPRIAYLAGLADGVPRWSDAEADAIPVLRGSYGEVSVRWVPALASYALLTMTGPEDDAGGAVVLRTAQQPWGPWSDRLLLFDWIADGLSFGDPARRFIRAFVADDPVGDDIFGAQAGRPGGAYAPYLYDADARPDGVRLRYTLSTWNPYQVVLMEHLLTSADLAVLGVARG